MQAITTKFISPTNKRGSRIKATCERGSITVSYPHELSGDDVHIYAKNELVKRFVAQDFNTYKTPTDKNPWLKPTVCGGIAGGLVVHVFIGDLFDCAKAFLDQQTETNRTDLRRALGQI